MLRIAFALVLLSLPAMAQTKPRAARAPVDKCAPIGQLADGTLVYSLQCDNLPVVAQPQKSPEAEIQRGGLFGMSYTRKRPDE